MFFEYPKLLWLLLVPFLLVLRYLYIEIADRRPHLRVSKRLPLGRLAGSLSLTLSGTCHSCLGLQPCVSLWLQ